MSDPGTRAADAAQVALEKRFRGVYRQAQKEIIEKLDAFTKQMNAQAKAKQAQLAAGQITQKQFNDWMNQQIFRQKQWKDNVDSVATTLMNANKQANAMVEGQKRAVFGENATYQAYKLEHDAGMDLSFNVYDSATVTRLLRDEPELLPRKTVNGKKDMAWNRHEISNAVTQGIIQGESIPEIAQRIARQTSSNNMKAMTRYARTAMTGAQNAGRMEMLHEAQDMGIKVKKKWLATLDKRTRDAHADLDGQEQDIDMPFKSTLGDIMYPGDPSADPANVYNCRCTMVYVYPEYEKAKWKSERRDQENDRVLENMSYNQWKAYKEKEKSGNIIRPQEDVTDEYISKAEPGKGKVTWDHDYKFTKKHEQEIKVGKWLNNKFGGDVQLLQEIDVSEGKKYCDYIWRSKYWELKSPQNASLSRGTLRTAVEQILVNPGGIILDYNSDQFKIDNIIATLDDYLSVRGFDLDVIIINKGELICVKRYKK